MTTAITLFKGELNKNITTYRALMRGRDADTNRYLAEATEAIVANPDLLTAHRGSLHQGLGTAASMGLSILPIMGEAFLIPRRRNLGTYQQPRWAQWVNFQPGYKGLIKLAHRSDAIDSFFVEVVYKGEHYDYQAGTNPHIDHTPSDEHRTRAWDDIVAAYAVVFLKGSTRPTFVTVSRKELEDVRQSTGTQYKDCSDPWMEHPEAQAKKTALIRVAKLLPREDKLRDFHRAVGHELALEGGSVSQLISDEFVLEDAKPSLATQLLGSSEPEISKRWTEAVKYFGTKYDVSEAELLAHIGAESPASVTDDQHDKLETVYWSIKNGETTADRVFRGAVVQAAASPEVEEESEPAPQHGDEDIPS